VVVTSSVRNVSSKVSILAAAFANSVVLASQSIFTLAPNVQRRVQAPRTLRKRYSFLNLTLVALSLIPVLMFALGTGPSVNTQHCRHRATGRIHTPPSSLDSSQNKIHLCSCQQPSAVDV